MRHLQLGLFCTLFIGCQGVGGSIEYPDLAVNLDLVTPVSVAWTTSVLDIQNMKPISGVAVCIAPANQVCATTGADGKAMLNVPISAQFMLSYTLTNYVSQFTEHTSTTAADGNGYFMVAATTEGVLAAAVGKQLDSAKGQLVVSAIDASSTALAGATFQLTPSGGDGPYYFGSMGLPDTNAKAASNNGLGFILNLTPGDFDVTATLAGKTCAGALNKSWAGTTTGSVKARLMAGGITTVSIACK